MHNQVQWHLVELFKAVADVVDAGSRCPGIIRKTYEEAMSTKEVQDFYKKLVEERTEEVFG